MNSKLSKFLWLSPIVVAGLAWSFWPSEDDAQNASVSYQTSQVSLGDIRQTISATGSLEAVDDVVIGAQLSGQITKIMVDFNDVVEQGQLLAQIDPSTFEAKVAQASALVLKQEADLKLQGIAIQQAEVNLEQAKRDLRQAQELFTKNHLSQNELDDMASQAKLAELALKQAHAQMDVLQANLASSKASLRQSQIDLDRTEIRAPIDGFVINRTIEAGQTVASSYNTPELFTLAKDLAQMEIHAHIDESDIGFVKLKQSVNFSVDAHPERRFRGQVTQIRQAPQENSGVVSYIVIMQANNPQGLLLPGMTANLTINVDTLHQVQRVPSTALRIGERLGAKQADGRPNLMQTLEQLDLSDEQKAQLQAGMPKRPSTPSSSARNQYRQKISALLKEVLTEEQAQLNRDIRDGKVRFAHLALLENGQPVLTRVQLGISDDEHTAVISPDLGEAHVITSMGRK
ncbi:efflux RND transporter periplasmic adaptor subunit [Paraferrimonas sedimenticola]|uniref:RND transporter n=1 Tax=Paraferrimonas sedimenticola TaxID=375674 RepID=A0AA37RYW9_9GAMM|nr:efflux RND transporter periplasmic adaptor subunit [Paraferrimonas sedimenticola]GLP98025.1 RND transporter [Paraferrimonas sedimenticola]